MNVRKILLLLSLFYSVSASADFSDKIWFISTADLLQPSWKDTEDIRIDFHAGDTLDFDCVMDWEASTLQRSISQQAGSCCEKCLPALQAV